ncbi:unnamed protein product [Penicillium salamii]|uniref:Uncharacterized protein n=1 Tax=Penicillium salamii TaxID=1612424 RepID=A0A9W4K4X6_9EURO|nr:unnamed protein product [Penicillium salamii]
MGVVSNRQSSTDYDDDMKRARDLGIDAFALNFGSDSYADTQLGYAYESAAKNDMKVFLSFDFNWYNTEQASSIGSKIKRFSGLSAQLKIENRVFVSSFAGDGVDIHAVQTAAGEKLFFAPNFHPGAGNFDRIQGALNWIAWENDGNNKAPTSAHNVTVSDGDRSYMQALSGKSYIAPVSAWFSTHFGGEVSYSKNWVFPSDLLWYNRWREILDLRPRFIEIITWNDYGESHYIGPLSSLHTDDGASKWVMDMLVTKNTESSHRNIDTGIRPHNGWLEMARPFIAAYKANASSAEDFIGDEKLIYWYRPTPKSVNCDATDTTMQGNPNNSSGNFFRGRPNGADSMEDSIFVVSLLKSAAGLNVQSGNKSQEIQVSAGINAYSVPMGVGEQKFTLTRGGKLILSGTSLKEISENCVCGIYNFNAYVGMVPDDPVIDTLQPAGLAMLSQGLKVPCPTNTLGPNAEIKTSGGV